MVRLLVPRLKDLYSGLLHIIYPNLCAGCDADLPTSLAVFVSFAKDGCNPQTCTSWK
ncbi:MAG: hypothetical protein IPM36_22670 [Lewinellaceae bacterium]|nr:hypothetical protein [Lewinellaceae bacterium]